MSPDLNPSRAISTSELLDAVPVPNQAVVCEYESESEAVLTVPVRKRWYMKPPLGYLLPFGGVRRIGLDRMGREVWKQCDGTTTTEVIVERFAAAHGVRFHEARISILQFLRMLTQRGVIVMAGRTKDGA